MKTKLVYFLVILFISSTAGKAQKGKWTILFDGGSTDKFRAYEYENLS